MASEMIMVKGSEKVGYVESYEGNGKYLINLEDGSHGWFHEKELDFLNYEPYPNEHWNIVHNLILALNNTKNWECYDIDSYDFIDFVCKQAGIDEETYMMVMKDELGVEYEEEMEEEFDAPTDEKTEYRKYYATITNIETKKQIEIGGTKAQVQKDLIDMSEKGLLGHCEVYIYGVDSNGNKKAGFDWKESKMSEEKCKIDEKIANAKNNVSKSNITKRGIEIEH